jgi:hypothetical protein
MVPKAATEVGNPCTTHRRVIVARHGGPQVPEVLEEDAPESGPGEIRD